MERPDLVLVDEKDFYYPAVDFPPLMYWIYVLITRGLDVLLSLEPEPQGLAAPLLSAYAKDAGFRVETVRNVSNRLLQRRRFIELLETKPLAVGISTIGVKKESTVRGVARLVRRHSPGSVIVLGGYGAQNSPGMRAAGDVTITGYGETALVRLLRDLKDSGPQAVLDSAPRDKGGARIIPGNLHYEGQEKMIFPDWASAPARPKHYNIEASRGCRFNCIYCNFPGKKAQAYRSPEEVAAEMFRAAEEFGVRKFNFVDSNLTSDPEFVIKLCALIREKGLKCRWRCFSRVSDFARLPELANAMAEAGCRWIFLGIEALDDALLRKMRKGYTRAEIDAGVSALEKAGIPIHANFIVGFPGETRDIFRETERYILRHKFKSVYLSPLLVTETMYAMARENPEEFCNLKGSSPRQWAHDTMDYAEAVSLVGKAALKINLRKLRPVVFPLGGGVPESGEEGLPPV